MSEADHEATGSLVKAIVDGYASSEGLAVSEIKSDDFPTIIKNLQDDRLRVQTEVKRISREVGPDVDGWIEQAKQLQVDIERSKNVAQEIIQQAEAAAVLRRQHQDLVQKCSLLEAEVNYTKRLENALGNIRRATNALSDGRQAAAHGEIERALQSIRNVYEILVELRPLENTIVIELVTQRLDQLRATMIEDISAQWEKTVHVDHTNGKITFQRHSPDENSGQNPTLPLDTIVDLSLELNILQDNILRTCRRITSTILKPRLEIGVDGQVAQLSVTDHEILIVGRSPPSGPIPLLNDIAAIITVLNNNLPPSTSVTLSESLMPPLASHLLSNWLMPSIPTSLAGLDDFQMLLQRVEQMASDLESIGWSGSTQLREWVDQGPKNWLSIRRQDSLSAVRNALAHGCQSKRTVERVETQTVSQDDIVTAHSGLSNEWGPDWTNNDNVAPLTNTMPKPEEEDDFSAWNTAEGSDQEVVPLTRHNGNLSEEGDPDHGGDGDEGDAWGWNENDSNSVPVSPTVERKPLSNTNGDLQSSDTENKEAHLTLKEIYTITAVPDELRDIVIQISRDAQTLRSEDYEDSPISPAAAALYTLPTLVFAGFRALAPTFYLPLIGGNMLLYNDCMRLASELEAFANAQAMKDEASGLSKSAWPSSRMRLDVDIAALESFGRRAYGKEMESQRVIMRDLLDGAQGFANCIEPPFAAACDDAIKSATDRLRDTNKQWSPILSRSALLQSLGSLLSTITSKMIVDIEDLSDISEAESQRLRHFCNEISTLSDLFVQENPSVPGEKKDMTALYTSNWIKFQYLSEIMESSLADIRYFWNDTNLKLEFDANELVDLVEALFADTDLRRKAIAEIRR